MRGMDVFGGMVMQCVQKVGTDDGWVYYTIIKINLARHVHVCLHYCSLSLFDILIWYRHIDGHHKMIRWKLVIHGGMVCVSCTCTRVFVTVYEKTRHNRFFFKTAISAQYHCVTFELSAVQI